MAEQNKVCFVIAPIGEDGSDIRRRSDQILKHIIAPIVTECGYGEPIRADKISEPGLITSQIIQHLVNDDLVIADLTHRNPNVFYELAVRHMLKKPIVQLIQKGEVIPFDISQSRMIQVDHNDLDSVSFCKEELKRQILSVENNPNDVDNPISVAVELQSLRQSDDPIQKSNAEIMSMLQELRTLTVNINKSITPYVINATNVSQTFRLGQTVMHPTFGIGKVLGKGANGVITVAFSNQVGIKTLDESISRLVDVDDLDDPYADESTNTGTP